MSTKTCFVIMPIRKAGTEDYSHFKAIYNQIKSVSSTAGFQTVRADEVQASGAITKDIIARLSDSDLVIADLTDLNANVFYELGVRHALRGAGTIMILDDKRTSDIPFDLNSYRAIKFKGELEGLDQLVAQLEAFIADAGRTSQTTRDNPVHDCYPSLPFDLVRASAGTTEGDLRKEIASLKTIISDYEKTYGASLSAPVIGASPLEKILAAINDAEAGHLPLNLFARAKEAYEARDVSAFLATVKTIVERNVGQ